MIFLMVLASGNEIIEQLWLWVFSLLLLASAGTKTGFCQRELRHSDIVVMTVRRRVYLFIPQ